MGEVPARILVYNRIDANRQNSRLLFIAFAAMALPIVCVASIFLAPFLLLYGPSSGFDPANPVSSEIRTEIAAVVLTAGFVVAAVLVLYVCFRSTSRVLLDRMHARRIDVGQQPDLRRIVENLCIGAGLIQPALYIVHSTAPNACALGRGPDDVSLVVTSGLLTLLDRRELASVLAHELSQIGNRDTLLSTVLTSLVAVVRFPSSAVIGILKLLWTLSQRSVRSAVAVLVLAAPFLFQFMMMAFFFVVAAGWYVSHPLPDEPPAARGLNIVALAGPFYVFVVAPVLALFLRTTISRQRVFLADADAVLLTRDPEALQLALTKIGSTAGASLNAGAATAHLYFADPLSQTAPWWDTMFPCHPAISDRIDLVAKMGDPVPPSAFEAATNAGREYGEQTRFQASDPVIASADQRALIAETNSAGERPSIAGAFRAFSVNTTPGTQFRLTDGVTSLYEKPDGWSRVVTELSTGAVVTFKLLDGNFAGVSTGTAAGYIPDSVRAVKWLPPKMNGGPSCPEEC